LVVVEAVKTHVIGQARSLPKCKREYMYLSSLPFDIHFTYFGSAHLEKGRGLQRHSQGVTRNSRVQLSGLSILHQDRIPQRPAPMSTSTYSGRQDLSESGITLPSDSENYESHHEESDESPPSSSSSPMILYSPPTVWGLLRGAAINVLLPFVNGLMLGFGELFANELAFQFGWSGTKVWTSKKRNERDI
jgi:hypothetical protein